MYRITLFKIITCILSILLQKPFHASLPETPEFVNSLGMHFVRIAPGSFLMGNDTTLNDDILKARELGTNIDIWLPQKGDFDERPVHEVIISKPYFMASTEVTNKQFEQFKPDHALLRGKHGFSIDDDEAVVFVSWHDAMAFTEWLSNKEGRPYRLATEAEWEYAARANTNPKLPFSFGQKLPDSIVKNPTSSWYPEPSRSQGSDEVVPLHVAQTKANPWGLFDMHGNVEEWVLDWYGPYEPNLQVDPLGRIEGQFKLSRGGSHGTVPFYLRSSNRMGTLADDRHHMIGFRVVLADLPDSDYLPKHAPPLNAQNVTQTIPDDLLDSAPDPDTPYFSEPRPFVRIPENSLGPIYSRHNHAPTIVEAPNGDLLAAWFSTKTERGREVATAASRLPYGTTEWQQASSFWSPPDRNVGALALWNDGKGTLYHFNGVSTSATWGPMAIAMRTSTDSGATWSEGRMIVPEHHIRRQVIPSVFGTRKGHIAVPADASPGSNGGTALHISADKGQTWRDSGANIAGIHAGVTQLFDGRLIALGRGDNIGDYMPMSFSDDMGKTWTYSASIFPPIGATQRLVLIRLKEGPLLFVSIARQRDKIPVEVTDSAGNVRRIQGIFAALSYDGGKTWPKIRLVSTDPGSPVTAASLNGKEYFMSRNTSEPWGYLAATQSVNGIVHLVSSWNHYSFNLKWLETTPPPGDPIQLLEEVVRPDVPYFDEKHG